MKLHTQTGRAAHARGIRHALAAAFAGLALAGCTVPLAIQRIDPAGSAPLAGLVYPLPFTQFQFTVTRTVTACAGDSAQVETTLKAGAPRSAPDPAHTYLIDPRATAGLFMAGDMKVAYAASGAAKAFNARSDDHAAAALADGVSVLARVALAARTACPKLVDEQTFLWPVDGLQREGRIEPPAALRVRWAAAGVDAAPQPLLLRITDGTAGAAAAAAPAERPAGVPYRLPRMARLQACVGDCGTATVLDVQVPLAQLGPLVLLPCDARRFSAQSCAIAFDAAGSPAVVQAGVTRPAGSGFAAWMKEVAPKLGD